nr:TspO/MBR family protein [Paenibacillus cymbidii]
MILSLVVFLFVYLLFSLSGILFPVDRKWYAALTKPNWAPSGKTIGLVWGGLYVLISLSLAIVQFKIGLKNTNSTFISLWVINYITNQAFSFFLFKAKRLDLSVIDTSIVFFTSLLLVAGTWEYSILAAVLLIPYMLWTAFATYLAWIIFRLNK